jgi:hypothetical protein
VRESLCGTCEPLPGGKAGFRLRNAAGLTFDGYTFDDGDNGPGSTQVLNVCNLARYGNRGEYGSEGEPLKLSTAIMAPGTVRGPHFFGRCKHGSCGACSGSQALKAGQDWRALAIGNSCQGDHDLDVAWAGVDCYF